MAVPLYLIRTPPAALPASLYVSTDCEWTVVNLRSTPAELIRPQNAGHQTLTHEYLLELVLKAGKVITL